MRTRRVPRAAVMFWIIVLLLVVGVTIFVLLFPDSREGVGLGVSVST